MRVAGGKPKYSRTPLIRTLVIRIILALRINKTRIYKLICLEITGYHINYNRVLWLQEFQIRRRRNV